MYAMYSSICFPRHYTARGNGMVDEKTFSGSNRRFISINRFAFPP